MYPNEVIIEQSGGVFKIVDPPRGWKMRPFKFYVGYCTSEKEVRSLYAQPMKRHPQTNALIPF